MKLFSWLNDSTTQSDSEDSEPPLSPILQSRLEELEKMPVKDVMTPRALVSAIDVDLQLRRVRRLKSSKTAYFPIYKGDLDNILGWVSKQKVLELLHENPEENPLLQHVRPAGTVLEDASVSDLADNFLKSASPFLVVKNAKGSTTGILLLSEFVELIFGFELNDAPPSPPPEPEPIQSSVRGFEI